ncbi:MAG: PDZ domain-containing protein [Phycisphaerae bacterium]
MLSLFVKSLSSAFLMLPVWGGVETICSDLAKSVVCRVIECGETPVCVVRSVSCCDAPQAADGRSGGGSSDCCEGKPAIYVPVGNCVAVCVPSGGAVRALPLSGLFSAVIGAGMNEVGDDSEAGGPWLGVLLAPIPPALAAQLGVEGGILILNVAQDSPAADAGIKQHDILLSIDGQELAGTDDLHDAVQDLTIGRVVEVEIIHAGKSETIDLKVGDQPEELHSLTYLYDSPAWSGTRIESFSPRLFMMGEDGGLLEPDKDSVKRFKMLIPGLRSRNAWSWSGGGDATVKVDVSEDGASTVIVRDAEGRITVTRSDASGESDTETYGSEEAFEDADPEAYELFSQSVKGGRGTNLFGPGRFGKAFQFRFHADDANEQIEQALKQFEGSMHSFEGLKALKGLKGMDIALPELRMLRSMRSGTSFETQDDGSIRVTTREDGDELVESFRNERELKRERPGLHRRYVRLQESSGDEK